MNIPFRKQILAAVGFFALAGMVLGQSVAILEGTRLHNNEFDKALETLGWDTTRIACTDDAMTQLANSIDNYDMLLSVPLFNFKLDGDRGAEILSKDSKTPIYARIRKYLQDGGVLVLTDSNYKNVRNWIGRIDPSLKTPEPVGCTSNPWQVFDYTRNVEPYHPIRSFPNYITEGDTWSHFPKMDKNSKWKVLTNCSEGYPTCIYQEIGKGFVVLTLTRQPHFEPLENYYAFCVLHRANVSVASAKFSDLKPGPGSLTLELKNDAPKGSGLTYELRTEDGKTQSFTTNFVGKVCQLDYTVTLRGPMVASLSLNLPTGSVRLFARNANLPPLFKLSPNAYRGILSTKRRLEDVDFLCEFAPATEDLTGAEVKLEFIDACQNKVLEHVFTLPTNAVPERHWEVVKLPKTLGAAQYTIKGTLKKGRITARSETSFEIVPPKPYQTIIDEDGTFLVNGQPYFPLGIYHVDGDYDAVADIGFNTLQFWKWQMGTDRFGEHRGLLKARANGMRGFFESNHGGDRVRVEFVNQLRENPGIMAWYVADEPHEGADARLENDNNHFHALDPNRPTFICSCRPDLFPVHRKYCDVLGFNPGGKAKTHAEYMAVVTNWLARAKSATEGQQALVLVPGVLSKSTMEKRRSIAYLAITHDIRGFMWYCWKQTGGGPIGKGLVENPEDQAQMKELLAEIKTFVPALLSTGRRTFEEGFIHGIALPNNPRMKRYVIMQNITDKAVTTDFVIPELVKVKEVRNGLTDEPFEIKEGRLITTIAPLDRLVLKW